MQQLWMHKFVYFSHSGGDWHPWMIDSMPKHRGDAHAELPMPDFVDELAEDGWEVVTGLRVDHPKAGLLLLILKRPRDSQPATPPASPGA